MQATYFSGQSGMIEAFAYDTSSASSPLPSGYYLVLFNVSPIPTGAVRLSTTSPNSAITTYLNEPPGTYTFEAAMTSSSTATSCSGALSCIGHSITYYGSSISANTTSTYVGKLVSLTATASPSVPSGYSLGIYSFSNGTAFKSSTSTPLSATITQTKATSIKYEAVLYSGSASSPSIDNGSSQEPVITWSNYSVSVTAANTNPTCGYSDQITATASPQFPSGYYLDLYDVTAATMLCSTTSTSCSAAPGIGAGSTNFEACVSTSSTSLSNTAGCNSLSVSCHGT
ncbi:MAG: hypothetical protein QXL94_08945 [Candidatus Parvarchaeum sp.]